MEGVSFVISKEVIINNQVGLHARPATFFIQKANEFKSSIWIEKDDRRVNAKSLLGVLSLGIVKGTAVNIVADGVDENEAIATLSALIDSGLLRVIPDKQYTKGVQQMHALLHGRAYCAHIPKEAEADEN